MLNMVKFEGLWIAFKQTNDVRINSLDYFLLKKSLIAMVAVTVQNNNTTFLSEDNNILTVELEKN